MLFKTFPNTLLVLFSLWTSDVDAVCSGRCEESKINPFRDAVQNHALEGHTIKMFMSTNFQTCYYNCFKECRCLSFQISNAGCVLMDEDRPSKPEDFQQKTGYQYYDMRREYHHSKDPLADSCLDAQCENNCCKSQPCLNNGQCTELCDNPKLKFNCTCAQGFTGKLCQIKVRYCKDYINSKTNGKYVVFDKDGNKLNVFCDFLSEKGFSWTLVESFSLENNYLIKDAAFFKDKPQNGNSPNWVKYRLSRAHMKQITKRSTYFRATCQFPIGGVKYVDYLRGRLSDFNLIPKTEFRGCAKYEYVNIRGHQCYNCTVYTHQTNKEHIHIDSCHSDRCGLGRVPGAITGNGEDNFGFYFVVNPDHRCSANSTTTTQWWLGGP